MQFVCNLYAIKILHKYMINKIFISDYLDVRCKKENGKFTLKLRVFQKTPRKQMLYATNLEYTAEEYKRLKTSKRLNEVERNSRAQISNLVSTAEEVKNTIPHFTFEDFEMKMGFATNGTAKLKYHFDIVIAELNERGSIGTAQSYAQSLNSLSNYFTINHRKEIDSVDISEITPAMLNAYFKYMINTRERSVTTVGIYLRSLRAVINYAIHSTKALKLEQYPFGKGKFQIPAPQSRKMALTIDQIKALFCATPKTEEQKTAKAFWFFSYLSNGMNIADMVSVRYKDIVGNQLTYYRKKTARTITNALPIEVHLNQFQLTVIEQYGVAGTPNDYIFGILKKTDELEVQYSKRKNFTRFINQHMQRLIKDNGLKLDISTYTARHSFTTHAILNNAGMEFVQQALGHTNPKTTNTYIASLGFEKTKQVNSLMFKNLQED